MIQARRMTFEVGKTYKTKGGWAAKVEAVDGLRKLTVKHEVLVSVMWHTRDGTAMGVNLDDGYDLIAPDAEQPATTQPAEPDYETKLRDQAALAILADPNCSIDRVWRIADLFMAERKERMEGR